MRAFKVGRRILSHNHREWLHSLTNYESGLRSFSPLCYDRKTQKTTPLRAFAAKRPGRMDVNKTLRGLYEEKRRLDAVIASLEANSGAQAARSAKRRGRKSMSRQERLRVSRRMKRYWENRRAQMRANTAAAEPPAAASSESASA